MSKRHVAFYTFCLVLMGAGWGLTMPLAKIAVSTGYGHFGLIFWQVVIGSLLMGVLCVLRGLPLRRDRKALTIYGIIALVGTIIPNTLSYQAAVHLPSGVMSLLISMIPIFGFVIALCLGNDRFSWRRFTGLVFGLIGVLLIVAPGIDLGLAIPVFWAAVYLVTVLCYGFEGNFIDKWGTDGLGPFQVMLGSSLVGVVVAVPLMLATGQYIPPRWPMPAPQWALIGSSVVHVLVYATYVWLAGRAGAVFTVQVSYMVTGFGLLWAYLILGEAYTSTVWIALAAIFAGMYLVQPRPKLAEVEAMGDSQGA